MLRLSWIAFFCWVFLGGSLLGAVMEASYLGEGERGILNQISFWQVIQEEQDWGFWEVAGIPYKFFQGMYSMITWDYAFINGTDWEVYKWFILGPLLTAFVYGIIMTLVGVFTREVT